MRKPIVTAQVDRLKAFRLVALPEGIMRDHTKLRAFELADEVALLIYRATRKFPKEEIWLDFPDEKSSGFSSIKHKN